MRATWNIFFIVLACKAPGVFMQNTTSSWNATTATTSMFVTCPDTWINAEHLGCFKFLHAAANLSWVEAQLKCESEGGYLAEPKTPSQAEFLHDMALLDQSFTGIQYWWLGLSDLGDEGNWMWAHSHEFVTEAFWGDNKPSNKTGNSDDCGVMVLRGNSLILWEDRSCVIHDIAQHVVAPVCQHDSYEASTTSAPTTATTMKTTTQFECPAGWREFEDHCYSLSNSAAAWNFAESDCVKHGGHLASIHSAAESRFVRSLYTNNFWIGGNYFQSTWSWSDESPWEYSNWYYQTSGPMYPCLYYYSSYDGWSNADCDDSTMYYVCKI